MDNNNLENNNSFTDTLRFKLSIVVFGLIFVLLLTLGINALFSIKKARKQSELALSENLIAMNKDTLNVKLPNSTNLIERLLAPYELAIDILASNNNLATLNDVDTISTASRKQAIKTMDMVANAHKDIDVVFMARPGKKIYTIPEKKLPGDFDPTKREWFKKAMDHEGQAIWTGPYKDLVKDEAVITVSKTVNGPDGELIGVVGTNVKLNSIIDAVRDSGIGNGGYLTLTDNQGNIIDLKTNKKDMVVIQDPIEIQSVIDFIKSDNKFLKAFRCDPKGNMTGVTMAAKKFESVDLTLVASIPDSETIALAKVTTKTVFYQVASSLKLALLGIVLAILLVLGLTYYYTGRLAYPIAKITGAVASLAIGDYKIELPYSNDSTEIGTLIRATSKVQDVLNDIVTDIANTTDGLGRISSTLYRTIKDLNDAFNNINEAIQEIADAATTQSVNMDDANNLVLSIADKMDTVAEISKELGYSANNASSVQSDADKMVKGLINTSMRSREEFNVVRDDVNKLMVSSKQITNAAELIENINEQTHLLALNAAIEAARAGEAGSGFAVVAGEIRQLSENVRDSTNDIAHSIREMNGSMEVVVRRIEEMDNTVNYQSKMTSRVQFAFTQINESLTLIIDNVNEMVESIEDMITNKDKTVESMVNVSIATEDIAESSKEVSSVSDAKLKDIKEISKIVEDLGETHRILIEDLEALGFKNK